MKPARSRDIFSMSVSGRFFPDPEPFALEEEEDMVPKTIVSHSHKQCAQSKKMISQPTPPHHHTKQRSHCPRHTKKSGKYMPIFDHLTPIWSRHAKASGKSEPIFDQTCFFDQKATFWGSTFFSPFFLKRHLDTIMRTNQPTCVSHPNKCLCVQETLFHLPVFLFFAVSYATPQLTMSTPVLSEISDEDIKAIEELVQNEQLTELGEDSLFVEDAFSEDEPPSPVNEGLLLRTNSVAFTDNQLAQSDPEDNDIPRSRVKQEEEKEEEQEEPEREKEKEEEQEEQEQEEQEEGVGETVKDDKGSPKTLKAYDLDREAQDLVRKMKEALGDVIDYTANLQIASQEQLFEDAKCTYIHQLGRDAHHATRRVAKLMHNENAKQILGAVIPRSAMQTVSTNPSMLPYVMLSEQYNRTTECHSSSTAVAHSYDHAVQMLQFSMALVMLADSLSTATGVYFPSAIRAVASWRQVSCACAPYMEYSDPNILLLYPSTIRDYVTRHPEATPSIAALVMENAEDYGIATEISMARYAFLGSPEERTAAPKKTDPPAARKKRTKKAHAEDEIRQAPAIRGRRRVVMK
jgi:hypothetical protein